MFKLIKMMGRGVNVPEPVRLKTTAAVSYKAGTLLKLVSGAAVNCTATDVPAFIAAQDCDATKPGVLAYALNADMILESPVSAAPTSLSAGDKVTLDVDNDSFAVGVSATTTGGVATVFDMNGARAAGDKLLIRFC